ncbi:DinB family protein [Saccharibacillus alkalitolerans]|uniref:DinB family protein n=1 Tax=Saccharibacillus alkalitolerans TaxID=2705290 RepID=A0ABX0F0R0_9BACL|nr:DinB family protein [Saccharibacillus alkalitolerans]NGZ74572.1 DinB family protein [Saccharibacillus alkalitolerans]
MESKALLVHLWDSCLDREGWFPPLEDALRDLTAEQAAWKPAEGASNSIRELVRHLTFYKKRLLLRAKGETEGVPEAENNDATFKERDGSRESWEADKRELFDVHRQLSALLAEADSHELDRPIPQEGTLAESIRSLAMHDAYHIGQIVLLSKLQGVWPEARRFG